MRCVYGKQGAESQESNAMSVGSETQKISRKTKVIYLKEEELALSKQTWQNFINIWILAHQERI